ncbi:YceG family protein [Oceanirhabdus seepicola]|uniref:Putative component of 'biosynthetic module' domain-containing protein n=1 Tax=Oceanirhabdus seepicola TaxID=2828781 RepID=A0A9J6P0U8_9CLOT|nr:YceG family protein [Oceanirhabdus seepicola]MCM1990338.1 hypothetical protein [Oceanirhabdus seepicola]
MKNWSLNHLEVEGIKWQISGDVITNAKVPVSNRDGFNYSSNAVKIPRIFYRFIGIKENINSYKAELFKIDKELSKFGALYVRFDKGLNREISLGTLGKLDNAWNRIYALGGINSNTIIEEIEKEGLIPIFNNKILELQVKNNLRGLLEFYIRNNEDIEKSKIKLIINNITHWLNLYFKKLIKDFDYTSINPKILYFGDISIDEVIFLNFVSTLGVDVLYYNPQGDESFDKFDPNGIFSTEILYNTREALEQFPREDTDRYKTSAYEAKEYMNKSLFTDESGFYRPWQFVEYEIENVTLKTTYEEIKIWIKENTQFRDGWKIEGKKLFIPNIFAKISGTHNDLEEYWREISKIIELKNVLFYDKLPLNKKVFHIEYNKFCDIYPRGAYSEFDIYKLLRAPWWKYKDLRLGLQRNIAEKIKEIIINPVIQNIDDEELRDFQVYLFSVLINLEPKIMELLQGFDYPGEVPKIIIYNNEKNGNLTYEDSIMLAFLNKMGVDIMIFNPSGYSDIERFISKTEYDNHTLEKMRFKLDYQKATEEKKGFFKKFFGK